MRRAIALAAILAAAAAACVIEAVDYSGKACPCPDAWACVNGRCALQGASDSGTLGDAPTDQVAGQAAFQVKDFASLWTTSETIRWGWATAGDTSQFGSYVVVIGKTQADVVAMTGSAERITQTTNFELGVALLPNSDVGDQVLATSTTNLTPDTTYYAELLATDTSGRVSVSQVALATTNRSPSNSLAVLVDADSVHPEGGSPWSLPCDSQLACTDGASPPCDLDYRSVCSSDASCGSVASDCYANIQEGGFAVSLAPITPDTAFLELEVKLTGWTAAYTKLQILVNGTWYGFPYVSLGNGDYRLVQVPLQQFQNTMAAPPLGMLEEYQLGSTWPAGSEVQIAEVRVRW